MQVSPQHFFIKRAIHYICVSVSSGSKKGEDYNFDFPKTYSLNFLDFDMDFGRDCTEVVQYYSFSNEAHPENRLDYLNMVFVLLPRFGKSIDECETLHDKLLYSLCHAHEHEEQPKQLRGNVFDRLFTVIKISNFSSMEQDEYIAKAMFRADQREQLRYAEDKGMERILEYLKEGHTLAEAEALLEQDKHARAMFRADQREQLRYAEDKGRKEVGKEIFSLWESGVPLAEAKKKLGLG
jgi:predicted transposase/invertase (TIGR01784 family)